MRGRLAPIVHLPRVGIVEEGLRRTAEAIGDGQLQPNERAERPHEYAAAHAWRVSLRKKVKRACLALETDLVRFESFDYWRRCMPSSARTIRCIPHL